jgi:hypothetical protein
MRTKEFFPRFSAAITEINSDLASAFGDYPFEWSNDESVDRLRNEIVGIQQRCGGDIDRLAMISAEALQDIFALRQTASDRQKLLLDLLQIDLALSVMGTAYAQKRLQLIFDWAIYSLCDVYPYALENKFNFERIAALFHRDQPRLYADWGRGIGMQWIEIVYYYVFKVGGLKEIARRLAPFVVDLLCELLPAEDVIQPSIRVADWAIRDQYSGRAKLIKSLQMTYTACPAGTETHLSLALSFCLLIGKDAGIDTKKHARTLLLTYADTAPANWKLQLMQAAFESDATEIERQLPAIFTTITAYRLEVLRQANDRVLAEYEFERSLTLILGLVVALVKAGRTAAAIRLLASWKGANPNNAPGDVLVIIPNDVAGALYSRESAVFSTSNRDHETTFRRLIKAINEFHGVNIVLHDDDRLDPNIATRPGLPEDPERSSHEYLNAIREQFLWSKAQDFLLAANDVHSLKVVSGLPCPVQPVMIRDLGVSWPIATTLVRPQPDRECLRVLIWLSGTLIGELQAGWIAELLSQRAAIVVRTGDLDTFRADYANPEYDVIWVTTHGEFDHNDPHRSTLALAAGVTASFDDLRRIAVPGTKRRLLVLDACDSGAVPVYGGLSDLGFGPLLAAKNQAVISHRWPVEQFASALFNSLLALGLRSESFFAAYQSAVATMARGKDAVLSDLSAALGVDNNLVTRIRNNESIRWNTLAIWGSPAFFE